MKMNENETLSLVCEEPHEDLDYIAYSEELGRQPKGNNSDSGVDITHCLTESPIDECPSYDEQTELHLLVSFLHPSVIV